MSRNRAKESKVINISPYEYIHVKDINSSIIKVIQGPQNFVKQENEEIVGECPMKMIVLPPMSYICIKNPVMKDEKGCPIMDSYGQVKLAYKELEYRFAHDYNQPFYLHYGEQKNGSITALEFVPTNKALKLSALRSCLDQEGNKKDPGDEWLFKGNSIYYPSPQVKVVCKVDAIILRQGEALRIKAKQNFTDRTGVKHKAGEEWLVRQSGAYIPDVYEDVVKLERAKTITDRQALNLRAIRQFKDVYGKEHKAGEQWLITPNISTWHILDIYEELVRVENITILTKDKYAVILNPVDENGKSQKGAKKLVKGEKSFFLQPEEELENGIQNVNILHENEFVLLQANERFVDETKEERTPGDKWLICGPRRFVPPIEVEVLENRKLIPLNEKEGIYVRNIKTGTVRSVIGKSYYLKQNEELWEKELSELEEKILSDAMSYEGVRDKTKVVTYKCPYNTVMQIYNYKTDQSRIVFGPSMVMLEPDEQFCLMFLSGKTPKVPGVIKTLYLNMGPTYTTDKIGVETSDHALLNIEVAYNWCFNIKSREDFEECRKIFSVRDCIGEMCSIMASRVRGAVADLKLNQFHKNSARVIRKAVMGENENKKICDSYTFENNLLSITNVDIKNIMTKDKATAEKLKVTVNLAIELTTKSQEDEARRQAESKDQEAKSQLQRKILEHNSKAEDLKKTLYELKSQTKTIEEEGLKEAEAKAKANSSTIEYQSRIKIATNNKEIQNMKNKVKNEIEAMEHNCELEHEKNINSIEIMKKEKLTEIETKKFENIIDAIGKETLVEISQAGPEAQVQLLKALGLEGFVMTDGNNPINLFNFADKVANNNDLNI